MNILRIIFTAAALFSGAVWAAEVEIPAIPFPQNYADGVHYRTAERGNIREEMYAPKGAIAAVKQGKPLPYGTVLTLVDFRDGELYRYVAMMKVPDGGKQYPAEIRTSDWQFIAYNRDQSVNRNDNPARCMACHQSQAANDYVFSTDAMKNAP